jgi:GntR family transcriptional regulator/MocR family aminotransferase
MVAATLIRKAAGRLQIDVPDQGMHLVAYLEPGRRDIEIEAAAARAGVVVRAISRFYRRASPRAGLMLGFSGFPRRLIVPAAELLAEVVAKHGPRARSGP